MDKNQQIVRLMIQELEKMQNGTETSVTDLLNSLIDESNDMTLDDFFAIDELFRKKALESGFILDSMKHDFSPMFSLDRSFIVRKIK